MGAFGFYLKKGGCWRFDFIKRNAFRKGIAKRVEADVLSDALLERDVDNHLFKMGYFYANQEDPAFLVWLKFFPWHEVPPPNGGKLPPIALADDDIGSGVQASGDGLWRNKFAVTPNYPFRFVAADNSHNFAGLFSFSQGLVEQGNYSPASFFVSRP
ncbi:MAG TPA: hypothetical protein PL159_00290 [Candidatus Paceibacterota bacterium]|nr:hypothetical protein [Candidatus Paceibacterota bacterium]